MKNKLFNLSVKTTYINQQHVRAALGLGALVLFVLGSGAPLVMGH